MSLMKFKGKEKHKLRLIMCDTLPKEQQQHDKLNFSSILIGFSFSQSLVDRIYGTLDFGEQMPISEFQSQLFFQLKLNKFLLCAALRCENVHARLHHRTERTVLSLN